MTVLIYPVLHHPRHTHHLIDREVPVWCHYFPVWRALRSLNLHLFIETANDKIFIWSASLVFELGPWVLAWWIVPCSQNDCNSWEYPSDQWRKLVYVFIDSSNNKSYLLKIQRGSRNVFQHQLPIRQREIVGDLKVIYKLFVMTKLKIYIITCLISLVTFLASSSVALS